VSSDGVSATYAAAASRSSCSCSSVVAQAACAASSSGVSYTCRRVASRSAASREVGVPRASLVSLVSLGGECVTRTSSPASCGAVACHTAAPAVPCTPPHRTTPTQSGRLSSSPHRAHRDSQQQHSSSSSRSSRRRQQATLPAPTPARCPRACSWRMAPAPVRPRCAVVRPPPPPRVSCVQHAPFVHGLHCFPGRGFTRTLGLQRLPDVEFNLLTMVRSLLPSPILWLVLGSPTLVVTPALADHDAPAADGALRGGGGDAARAVGQRQLLQQDGAYA